MPKIDVIVVGRGPAGLATAAVIARDGARVALVGPPPPAANDTRTAALFTGSMNLLQHIGARALLEPDITPLKGIRIVDDGPGPLHAPEVTFEAREIGLPDFGANVPQMPLVDALNRVAAGCAGISVIDAAVTGIDAAAGMARVKLDNGDAIAAPLVAAADGRNSFCRNAAGIAADAWDYPQVAITAQFEHSRDHRGLSTEFHRPSGPCTVVPMPGLRSSLVWVERPAAARRLGDMDDAGFARALEERLHGILGTIGDIGVRRQFPLGCLKARSLGQGRVALVGEAGHMLPPIGAQGLNLGFRDAAALADLISAARSAGEDIGGDGLLARYDTARRSDIELRTAAVDLFNRSLIAEFWPADLIRGAGMHAITAIGALKRRVMRAGFEPVGALPRLMRA